MTRLKILCLILFTGLAGAAAVTSAASAAQATKGRQFLGGYQNWDAFTEMRGHNEKACYTISVPKEKHPSKTRRGEVYIMVTNWPKAKVENQISIIMGYQAKKGSTVTFTIDKKTFKMFIDNDRAWAWDSNQDNEMTKAMKKATGFTVKGTSSRGTETTDRYSLSGFTAAHNAITKACH